jgi:hypothetical protein
MHMYMWIEREYNKVGPSSFIGWGRARRSTNVSQQQTQMRLIIISVPTLNQMGKWNQTSDWGILFW